jgi:hypothetical protein
MKTLQGLSSSASATLESFRTVEDSPVCRDWPEVTSVFR